MEWFVWYYAFGLIYTWWGISGHTEWFQRLRTQPRDIVFLSLFVGIGVTAAVWPLPMVCGIIRMFNGASEW